MASEGTQPLQVARTDTVKPLSFDHNNKKRLPHDAQHAPIPPKINCIYSQLQTLATPVGCHIPLARLTNTQNTLTTKNIATTPTFSSSRGKVRVPAAEQGAFIRRFRARP